MGRQTRQARRAQERRQLAKGAHGARGTNWSIIAIAGIIAVAIAIFAGILLSGGATNSATQATATIPPGPTIAGIGCDQGMPPGGTHIHSRLTILNHGKVEQIDPNFGHDYTDDCLFWMHSHQDANGVIHMESPHPIHPTIATWLKIAHKTIPKDRLVLTPKPGEPEKVFVNLKPYHGNPLTIKLSEHKLITIELGKPFSPPQGFNWAKYQL
ncbi:MAG: hypothetical protein ACRDFX_04780 [Chloroflexota bacterium]